MWIVNCDGNGRLTKTNKNKNKHKESKPASAQTDDTRIESRKKVSIYHTETDRNEKKSKSHNLLHPIRPESIKQKRYDNTKTLQIGLDFRVTIIRLVFF